jgi:hypothetical protein
MRIIPNVEVFTNEKYVEMWEDHYENGYDTETGLNLLIPVVQDVRRCSPSRLAKMCVA